VAYWRSYGRSRHSYMTVPQAQNVPNVRDDDGSKNLAVRLLNLANSTANTRDGQFVGSIRDWFTKKGYLTASQFSNFERIEKKLSPPPDDSAWETDYTPAAQARFAVAVRYYRGTSYFTDVLARLDRDPEFKPSRPLYERMTGNKFVGGAIREGLAPAKFKVGQMVQLRVSPSSNGLWHAWKQQACTAVLHVGLIPLQFWSYWDPSTGDHIDYQPSPTGLYVVLTVNEYGPFIGHKGSKIYTLHPVSLDPRATGKVGTLACEEQNLKAVK
jgi:hypothetical protein